MAIPISCSCGKDYEHIPVMGGIALHCPDCFKISIASEKQSELPPESQGEQAADWTLEQQIERLFTGFPLSPPSRKEIAKALVDVCVQADNWADEHDHEYSQSDQTYKRLEELFERLSK